MSSMAARVFKGCRVLLAPASKSSTTATSSTATKPKAKAKSKSSSDTPATPNNKGIMKLTPVSSALGDFVGSSEASRAGAVKVIWAYIKTNNLQNPANKKEIICDDKLKTIFDGKDKVGFLEIGKLLSSHFVKTT